MKYKKGTFTVVPNLQYLAGKPPEMQTVFFWVCSYANDDGKCFPSRSALASKAGMSIRTVDKYMEQLVELGILTKTPRLKKGTIENTSNLYQIMLPDSSPSENDSTTPSASLIPVTIPSINNTNLTTTPPKAVEKEFNFKEEMQKLIESTWKPNKIMWSYFTKKKFVFENHAQMKSEIGRCKKPAIELQGYNSKQIEDTMDYCQEKWQEQWSLYAVVKQIANVISNK